ncbi:uncharacterized protein LOC133885217 [Phragmites australis]|uniref:uncharacterized protein LOC133885217 n=1 Tax=Phragmites australis TaxID=29695 RepID=UPI002D772F5A|nr:uncharacterized protein LOC133885217 [Phragmites australis]
MGNSLPLPCVCHDANMVATTAAAAKKRRRKKPACWNVVRAPARHVVPVVDMPAEDGEVAVVEEEGAKEVWPGCRVEPVGHGEDGRRVRVKIVMKRKDVAELVARLEQRGAAERKARMDELNTDLGGGSVTMSPCRDAWRPRLASIPEN